MGNQQLTDLSFLREVAMGDDEIVIETTEAFVEDTPAAIQKLQDHFANQQWEALYKQAHKIRPGLKYMGMDSAVQLALDIEEQARSGEISEEMGNKIRQLHELCSQAVEELSEKIDGLK